MEYFNSFLGYLITEKPETAKSTYYDNTHDIIMTIPRMPNDLAKIINGYAEEKREFLIRRAKYNIRWLLPDMCRGENIPDGAHMIKFSNRGVISTYIISPKSVLKLINNSMNINLVCVQSTGMCEFCKKNKHINTLITKKSSILGFCNECFSNEEYFWKQGLTLGRIHVRKSRMTCNTGKRRSNKKKHSMTGIFDRLYRSRNKSSKKKRSYSPRIRRK